MSEEAFFSWLKLRAPESIRDYARYYARFSRELESLELRRIPCNSWALKLAGLYVEFLLFTGRIILDEYARLRMELCIRRKACQRRSSRVGVDRCPERLPPLSGRQYWVWRALLESGVRAKHLWRVPWRRAEEVEGVLIWDLRKGGTKRVNVVIMSSETASRLYIITATASYRALKDRAARLGAPVSCARKIHWNICLAVTGDRRLCGFIQGRWAPVDIVHYEEWKLEAARASKEIWPLTRKVLERVSFRELLRLVYELKDYPPLNRVEPSEENVPRPEPQSPGEPGWDVDTDIVSVLSLYSNRLG